MFKKIQKMIQKISGKAPSKLKELTSEDFFREEVPVFSKCSSCKYNSTCNLGNFECNDIQAPKNNLPSILIIDDNEGICSFLEDDFRYLMENNKIPEMNIIKIHGIYAAFELQAFLIKNKNIDIKYAIIDITLGGLVIIDNENVKYTGVDIYKILKDFNPNIKYIFYTGNNLNTYIKSNKELIDKYKEISGKDIKDNLIYKTALSMKDRRELIFKKLFKEEV